MLMWAIEYYADGMSPDYTWRPFQVCSLATENHAVQWNTGGPSLGSLVGDIVPFSNIRLGLNSPLR